MKKEDLMKLIIFESNGTHLFLDGKEMDNLIDYSITHEEEHMPGTAVLRLTVLVNYPGKKN